MPSLTDAQIAGYAAGAGWTGSDLVTAVAVALAEHRGHVDTTARGDVALQTATWGPSVGVWQIRSLKAQKGTGAVRDELANLDPATNASHAHQIWGSSGWRAWSTYNDGLYLLYKGRAATAVGQSSTAPSSAGSGPDSGVTTVSFTPAEFDPSNPLDWLKLPGGIVGALQTIATGAVKTAHWLSNRHNVVRVAQVLIGGTAVVTGLYIVARPAVQPVVEQAQQATAKAVKVAAMAAK